MSIYYYTINGKYLTVDGIVRYLLVPNTKIVGGYRHSAGLDSLGKVWGWGDNYTGQIGNNSIK